LLRLIALLILLAAAAFGAIKAANAILENRYPAPGRMVSVGTHRLQLYCTGEGAPTVVIEPGLGADWSTWAAIVSSLSPAQRVCVYDRAGYGWSEAGPMPRTVGRSAGELHELLVKAEVPGPYVLVGHSLGAHVARSYASRFASSLKGVVLVEPADEKEREPIPATPRAAGGGGLVAALPPLGLARIKRMYAGEDVLPPELKTAPQPFRSRYIIWSPIRQLDAEKSELASLLESDAEVRAAKFPPDVPLTVITALRGKDPRIHIAMQERLARLSPVGRHVVTDSKGHFVQLERPQLVLDAIRAIR
jgi:pimeloyl-ACP methyl ester carboxylesterase